MRARLATFAHLLHIRAMLAPGVRHLRSLVAAATSITLVAFAGSAAIAQALALHAQGTARTPTGTLGGMVFDSTANVPLAGATVLLTHATRADVEPVSLTSDADGRFVARDLPLGRWLVTFLHRAADEYGIAPIPHEVAVIDGNPSVVTLSLPPARILRSALCGRGAGGDSLGILVGSVRDAETGAWMDGATVLVSWRVITIDKGIHVETRRLPATTGSDGTFRICRLPSGDALAVSATAPVAPAGKVRRSGELFIVVAPIGITRLELGIGELDAAAAADTRPGARLKGRSRLGGVVVDALGKPRADVRVLVVGTGQFAVTGDAGTFAIDSLPAGSWTVEARAIGMTPVRAMVQLAPDTTTTATLAFERWVPTLDRVVVYGRVPPEQKFMDDFLMRRDRGLGNFYTAAEIEERNIQQLSQLLAGIPGVRVHANPRPGRSPVVLGRGNCAAEVFVNGVFTLGGNDDIDALVRPREILALEVHDDVNGAPSTFGSRSGCVVIGIWTRKQ